MSDIDKRILQVVGILGVFALVAIAYYFFMFGKKAIQTEEKKWGGLDESIATVKNELLEINAAEAQKGELERLSAYVEQYAKRLPSNPEAEDFLNNLVDMLRKSQVINRDVVPVAPKAKSAYTEIPWNINCTGAFYEFGPFINMVELNPNRFMRVKTFTIRNDYQLPGYHPISISISTYMFNE